MSKNTLFEAPSSTPQKVVCLGIEFESDAARRAYFIELLRKKLQDPEFRKIEGFPIGEDEAILALSDPPYYTACPNPWIADFVAEWEAQKPPKPEGYVYHREPFAADVSEGKSDPIYNIHSYHTKVPHKAIMRYILHYTEPGDLVFDGFCGSGMTAVAAQLCSNRDAINSLGYQVHSDGTIWNKMGELEGKNEWEQISKIGSRRAVLNDLSPAATFIAHNYNSKANSVEFGKMANQLLQEIDQECGWMYETFHSDGKTIGQIEYIVWSEVFRCSECDGDVVFLEEAMDLDTNKVLAEYPCPHCTLLISKKKSTRSMESYFDFLLNKVSYRPKRKPIQIVYRVGKSIFKKAPDQHDFEILARVDSTQISQSISITEYPFDDMWEAPRLLSRGISHVHHLFLKRQLLFISKLWEKATSVHETRIRHLLTFFVEQAIWTSTTLNRYRPAGYSQVNQYMSGVYYMPSQISECSPQYILSGKAKRLVQAFSELAKFLSFAVIGTSSSSQIPIPDASFDYIFLDPPFGDNFAYRELNFLVESWLGVLTSMQPEAIVDRAKKNQETQKGLNEYRQLMTDCFRQAYRVLKPGRWMTVEFSNTKASVWNSIQVALTEAGFIVANVSALDKQQGSFKAVTTPTAVKQDLVISAYKPNGGFEERFLKEAQTDEGVWDFVRTHLKYLPVTKLQDAVFHLIPERDPRILFDQMVSYYVRKGFMVPLSSQEFQAGLAQRFSERDGMYFLPEQALEYDRKKMASGEVVQISLFVSNEETAILWLRQYLKEKPQTFADINPHFMQQLGGWNKNEAMLDLRELLNQNFLCYEGEGPVPEAIHAYLSSNWKDHRGLEKDDPQLIAKAKDRWYLPDPNKASDLEKLRERALLKEFESYRNAKKRLKVFRLEAVRAGFKKAWQDRDYHTIINVAELIPHNVLEEDPKLLMWYDQALTRKGGN